MPSDASHLGNRCPRCGQRAVTVRMKMHTCSEWIWWRARCLNCGTPLRMSILHMCVLVLGMIIIAYIVARLPGMDRPMNLQTSVTAWIIMILSMAAFLFAFFWCVWRFVGLAVADSDRARERW